MKRASMLLVLLLLPVAVLELGLRAKGIGGSIVYVEDAACGYRPKPNQRFSTLGVPVTILDSGFRGPPATNNLLFIGDSVTYGTAYLRDEDTFAAMLGGANAGVNGWSPQNMARFLEQVDLAPYRAVVWVVPTCDVLRPFMGLRGGLISTHRRMWLRVEYLLRFVWYGHVRPQPDPALPEAYEPNREAILSACARLRAQGLPVLLVFLPYRDELRGAVFTETPYVERLVADVAAAGLPHVAARPTGDPDALYRDAGHLSPAGNRWLADLIADTLAQENL